MTRSPKSWPREARARPSCSSPASRWTCASFRAKSYGAALHYFTGSKSHNIAIRKLGQARGLKINEYGIFRDGKRIGGRTEEEVFSAVGLPYIEPELREDRGEIQAAFAGQLPKLISLEDIRGDLHVHTKASDGKSSLREMVEAARARGYEYVAITDHTKHATVARGLDEKRLAKQLDEIEKLSEDFDDIRILKSSEVDILADGKLDLSDSMLKRLDLVVAAVHYKFELNARGANRAHAAGHGQQISEHPCSPDRAFTR